MELVAFTAHVHGSSLSRGCHGGEIGIDVILPETQARKDVRRHMQSVRGSGSNLRISTRRRETKLSQLRLVVAVDQIVGNARMIGFHAKEFLKYLRCFFTIVECRVVLGL